MKILSLNISEPKEIIFNGKTEVTGIFKKPVNSSIILGKEDVEKDFVADRVHHGGLDKACYIFGFNHYAFFKEKFSEVDFEYGIFGENITLDFLDESKIKIGDTYEMGNAVIQVTQPRQPCYKLGIRFNNPVIINEFKLSAAPGVYVRVLQPGEVKSGDEMKLVESFEEAPTVLSIYRLIYQNSIDKKTFEQLMENTYLAESIKNNLRKKQIV